jgi:hypothetical protein
MSGDDLTFDPLATGVASFAALACWAYYAARAGQR